VKSGLFVLVISVILGGLIGTLVVRDPGYVLISYDDAAVETSLWFALLLLVLAYLALRLVMYVLNRSRVGTGRLGSWLKERKSRQARQRTVQGLLLMAEGQWAEARKVLVSSAREVGTPLINFLSAARAAHEMGDSDSRDELLRKAHESTPGSRLAVGLTQAQLQMNGEQWEQCLATLLQLKSNSPRHPQVLGMLCQVYQELEDWQALIELLPELRKRRVPGDADLDELLRRAWCRRFDQRGTDPADVWRNVPKDLKRQPEVILAYAEALCGQGAAAEAEAALRSALHQTWNEDLVDLYGRVIGSDPGQQLVTAETWVKERPNDAGLLLALGRISLMNGLWDKAREYLEASLRLGRSPEVYGELGRLCVALGDSERGSQYLARATVALPELPLPAEAAS
jgi:HemY protein